MIEKENKKTVLVTGTSGMIGSAVAKELLAAGNKVIGTDIKESAIENGNYIHFSFDLSDEKAFEKIVEENQVDRIVHIAALAHSVDGKKYSREDYFRINVECSKNVFKAAKNIPVLFISTVDVYGFTKGKVNAKTKTSPVSNYAKSKVLAEEECKKLEHYTIFRFSPVYTDTMKRDIQKRYYLRYPDVAYKIGKGTEYEVLNIRKAVEAVKEWCEKTPLNDIQIIKDEKLLDTAECIRTEKEEGRAKIVLWFPKRLVEFGYRVIKMLTGENKYTYLLNKAVNPLRSE